MRCSGRISVDAACRRVGQFSSQTAPFTLMTNQGVSLLLGPWAHQACQSQVRETQPLSTDHGGENERIVTRNVVREAAERERFCCLFQNLSSALLPRPLFTPLSANLQLHLQPSPTTPFKSFYEPLYTTPCDPEVNSFR